MITKELKEQIVDYTTKRWFHPEFNRDGTEVKFNDDKMLVYGDYTTCTIIIPECDMSEYELNSLMLFIKDIKQMIIEYGG